MSAATVTYHELPPMGAWVPEQPFPHHLHQADLSLWPADAADHLGPFAHLHHPPPTPTAQPPPQTAHQTPTSECSTGGGHAAGWTGEGAEAKGGGGGVAEELCLVCGDKASGYHYNSLTCEGCKGFFRRSITRKAQYYCKYGGHCDIDMYMRRKCQCCRLRKCMDVGMRPELVIPEEQCRKKREAKQKMRSLNAGGGAGSPGVRLPSRVPSPGQNLVSSSDTDSAGSPASAVGGTSLSAEQTELLQRLLSAQAQLEAPSDEALAKLSPFASHFQHLAELTILSVQLILETTKALPGWAGLAEADQLLLLKASSAELLMLRTARGYDPASDRIVFGNAGTNWAYDRQSYRLAGIGHATDSVFDFAASLARLGVDPAEFALLSAITVFSDRPGLSHPQRVEDIQEVYTSALQAYVAQKRPSQRGAFARLLMKLSELRSLGNEQADLIAALTQHSPAPSSPTASSPTTSSSTSTHHQPFP